VSFPQFMQMSQYYETDKTDLILHIAASDLSISEAAYD